MKPLTPTTPHVIIMVGIPGAGKTHFAEHFAKTFGAPYVNHHAVGELAGSDDATHARISSHFLDELLKTHRTIVFEGPTHTKAIRQALMKKIIKAGYKPLLVWVQTESVEAKRRSTKKGGTHTSSSYDQAIGLFQPPQASEQPVVISGKHTYASQVKMVLKHLAGTRDTRIEAVPRTRVGRNITVR